MKKMNRILLLSGMILGVALVLSTGCDKYEEEKVQPSLAPLLAKTLVYKVTDNSAMCEGKVIDSTGAVVTDRGICWSTSAGPTTGCNKTSNGSGCGTYECCLKDLLPNTTYHVRSYAISEKGTGYGWEAIFTTPSTVTDIDGNVYHTVIIGDQTWMAENLRVTHYRNGAMIPEVKDNTEWMLQHAGAYCSKSESWSQLYGYFYNFHALLDTRGLAPEGWHVPSDAEWKILEGTVDSQYLLGDAEWDKDAYRGSDAGGNLKSTTDDWQGPNLGATNKFGFSALPAGFRSPWDSGEYIDETISAVFLTSTLYNESLGWGRVIRYENSGIYRPTGQKVTGAAVRCVKD